MGMTITDLLGFYCFICNITLVYLLCNAPNGPYIVWKAILNKVAKFREQLFNSSEIMLHVLVPAELRQAVLTNDYMRLTLALKAPRKYDMEQPDHAGVTLLMIAAQHGQWQAWETQTWADFNHWEKKGGYKYCADYLWDKVNSGSSLWEHLCQICSPNYVLSIYKVDDKFTCNFMHCFVTNQPQLHLWPYYNALWLS